MPGESYRIGATDIKKLRGGVFEVRNQSDGQSIPFSISDDGPGDPNGPRPGREGVGLCVDCHHPRRGVVPSFLKIFRHDVPHRHPRNRFLVQTGLAKRHWLFAGVPYAVLPTEREVNGVRIVGHIAQRIVGKDGEQARDLRDYVENDQWDFSRSDRIRLCGQLCCALVALEGLELVHGDLSLGNVLIGHDHDAGHLASLCDFDGFHHPRQEVLPLKYEGVRVRGGGSRGFQHPSFLERAVAGEDTYVDTDRFGLGALICQMMVWKPDSREELGNRLELLSGAEIQQRSAAAIPQSIKRRWPEGFEVLENSLKARTKLETPGPRDWLALLGGPARAPHVLHAVNRRRNRRFRRRIKSDSGSLASLGQDLSSVRFKLASEGVELEFGWDGPVFHKKRGGVLKPAGKPVILKKGETVASNFWEFTIT